ncbi:hypothetical protein [Amycolatopsis acidicola]|nr:hypothetical protein [Amycolatopsis acidicola]
MDDVVFSVVSWSEARTRSRNASRDFSWHAEDLRPDEPELARAGP